MIENTYNNLDKLLKTRKITLMNFCKTLNISPTILYRWAKNEGLPNIETLLKMTGYLNVNIDYFLGEELREDTKFIDVPNLAQVSYNNYSTKLKEFKISTRSLCQELDISTPVISNWKNGRSMPKSETLYSISQYLNISLGVLLGCEDPKPAMETFTREEKFLLATYRNLNGADKDKVIDFMVGLL